MNCVHKDERIHAFQWTVLPCVHFRRDLLHDLAYQSVGNFYVIQILDLLGDIPLTHSAGVQSEDFFFHAVGVPAVFADDFRFILAVPVAGNFDIDFAELRFYGLFRVAVAVVFALAGFCIFRRVSAFFVAQRFLQFGFHDLLKDVAEQVFHTVQDVGGVGEVLTVDEIT